MHIQRNIIILSLSLLLTSGYATLSAAAQQLVPYQPEDHSLRLRPSTDMAAAQDFIFKIASAPEAQDTKKVESIRNDISIADKTPEAKGRVIDGIKLALMWGDDFESHIAPVGVVIRGAAALNVMQRSRTQIGAVLNTLETSHAIGALFDDQEKYTFFQRYIRDIHQTLEDTVQKNPAFQPLLMSLQGHMELELKTYQKFDGNLRALGITDEESPLFTDKTYGTDVKKLLGIQTDTPLQIGGSETIANTKLLMTVEKAMKGVAKVSLEEFVKQAGGQNKIDHTSKAKAIAILRAGLQVCDELYKVFDYAKQLATTFPTSTKMEVLKDDVKGPVCTTIFGSDLDAFFETRQRVSNFAHMLNAEWKTLEGHTARFGNLSYMERLFHLAFEEKKDVGPHNWGMTWEQFQALKGEEREKAEPRVAFRAIVNGAIAKIEALPDTK